MIDWNDGAVCFAGGRQWEFSCHVKPYSLVCCNNADLSLETISSVIKFKDFKLNEIREGDYIEASEIDTEQKYSDAVSVFGLFGWSFPSRAVSDYEELRDGVAVLCAADFEAYQNARDTGNRKRKLTYPQLMAIGKLKRAMIERERAVMVDKIKAPKPVTKAGVCNELGVPIPFKPKRRKSKQAYDILKTLDYEYDLVKQQWYKKAYI